MEKPYWVMIQEMGAAREKTMTVEELEFERRVLENFGEGPEGYGSDADTETKAKFWAHEDGLVEDEWLYELGLKQPPQITDYRLDTLEDVLVELIPAFKKIFYVYDVLKIFPKVLKVLEDSFTLAKPAQEAYERKHKLNSHALQKPATASDALKSDYEEMIEACKKFCYQVNPPPQHMAAADVVNNVWENMVGASEKFCSLHHVDPEILTKVLDDLKVCFTRETSKLAQQAHEQQAHEQQERKQKLTPEQQPAADDAVNNVLEEMTQACKKICYAHNVDQEIVTKVWENLKDSITHETLTQLAKRPQQKEKKGNNVSEEITQLPASKKMRYAHDDQEILSKVSEEFDTQETKQMEP